HLFSIGCSKIDIIYVHTLCVSSGEAYHEHFTATTTPPVELLVACSTGRQNHPTAPNRREMEQVAPHSQISIAPSERRYSLILRCLDASMLYQGGLRVCLSG